MDESLVAAPINRKLRNANGVCFFFLSFSGCSDMVMLLLLIFAIFDMLGFDRFVKYTNVDVVIYFIQLICNAIISIIIITIQVCYLRRTKYTRTTVCVHVSSILVLRFGLHIHHVVIHKYCYHGKANGAMENQPLIMHIHDFKTIWPTNAHLNASLPYHNLHSITVQFVCWVKNNLFVVWTWTRALTQI